MNSIRIDKLKGYSNKPENIGDVRTMITKATNYHSHSIDRKGDIRIHTKKQFKHHETHNILFFNPGDLILIDEEGELT